MIDAIVEMVEENPGLPFNEMYMALRERGYEVDGTWSHGATDGLVYWAGMSEEWGKALTKARRDGKIHMHMLTSEFEILVFYWNGPGPVLNIPLFDPAKLDKPSEDLRWIPVIWYPGSRCNAHNCAPHNKYKTKAELKKQGLL